MRALAALSAATRASPLGIAGTAWRAGASRLHRTHADPTCGASSRHGVSGRTGTGRSVLSPSGLADPLGQGRLLSCCSYVVGFVSGYQSPL